MMQMILLMLNPPISTPMTMMTPALTESPAIQILSGKLHTHILQKVLGGLSLSRKPRKR